MEEDHDTRSPRKAGPSAAGACRRWDSHTRRGAWLVEGKGERGRLGQPSRSLPPGSTARDLSSATGPFRTAPVTVHGHGKVVQRPMAVVGPPPRNSSNTSHLYARGGYWTSGHTCTTTVPHFGRPRTGPAPYSSSQQLLRTHYLTPHGEPHRHCSLLRDAQPKLRGHTLNPQ